MPHDHRMRPVGEPHLNFIKKIGRSIKEDYVRARKARVLEKAVIDIKDGINRQPNLRPNRISDVEIPRNLQDFTNRHFVDKKTSNIDYRKIEDEY